jgi:hypothetical protein
VARCWTAYARPARRLSVTWHGRRDKAVSRRGTRRPAPGVIRRIEDPQALRRTAPGTVFCALGARGSTSAERAIGMRLAPPTRRSGAHRQAVRGERFFQDPERSRSNAWRRSSSDSLRSATSASRVTPIEASARVAGAPILGRSSSGMCSCSRVGHRWRVRIRGTGVWGHRHGGGQRRCAGRGRRTAPYLIRALAFCASDRVSSGCS